MDLIQIVSLVIWTYFNIYTKCSPVEQYGNFVYQSMIFFQHKPTVHTPQCVDRFCDCIMLEVWRRRRRRNKITHSVKDPGPPRRFLYLRETKICRCEGGGEGEEKVHLKSHTTARGACVKISTWRPTSIEESGEKWLSNWCYKSCKKNWWMENEGWRISAVLTYSDNNKRQQQTTD